MHEDGFQKNQRFKVAICESCHCEKQEVNCSSECYGYPYKLEINTDGGEECRCFFETADDGIF